MTRYYWYKLCPVCKGQGRLIITEDITNQRLYLHCEECEWGWVDPDLATDASAGFLTLDEEFDSIPAGDAAIHKYGWSKYATHYYEE